VQGYLGCLRYLRISPLTVGQPQLSMVTAVSLEFGSTPRYLQLAEIIREQILAGELPEHTPIPSKRVTRQTYGVAGSTHDRAVEVLKDLGMIVTVPGLGLYVTERKHWQKPTTD
jgi:GntR family transcriptional regulator